MANVKISALPAAGALTGAELVPIVQTGTNRRTTVDDIVAMAGGGGSSSLIQIASALSFTTIPEAGEVIIPLDPDVFGGAFYRLQGTDLAWGGVGNETKVDFLTDGFYSLTSVLVTTAGTEDYGVGLTPWIDGAITPLLEYGTSWVPTGGTTGISARVSFTKLPISAGSFLELHVTQVGNVSNDNGIAGFTVVVTKDA